MGDPMQELRDALDAYDALAAEAGARLETGGDVFDAAVAKAMLPDAGRRVAAAARAVLAAADTQPEPERYEMRCPSCGSRNVTCNGKPAPHHDHECHACGQTLLPCSLFAPSLEQQSGGEPDA